jgi:histidine triad (HIT) family protein
MPNTLQGIPSERGQAPPDAPGEASGARVDTVPECLFCRIVAGETAAHTVLETEDLVAFLDHRPVFKGHMLLVPRAHVVTLPDLPSVLRDPFLAAGQQLAAAVVTGLGSQGSFLAVNNTVSQSVPHLHMHVVPRTKGDGLRGFFWPRTKYSSDGEMREYADRLAKALADIATMEA